MDLFSTYEYARDLCLKRLANDRTKDIEKLLSQL